MSASGQEEVHHQRRAHIKARKTVGEQNSTKSRSQKRAEDRPHDVDSFRNNGSFPDDVTVRDRSSMMESDVEAYLRSCGTAQDEGETLVIFNHVLGFIGG